MLSDPPQHTFFRSLVQQAFTPKAIAAMSDRIEQLSHSLLDEVADRHEWDLHDDYAFPLPVIVIAGMLGVPESDIHRFKDWSDAPSAKLTFIDVNPNFAPNRYNCAPHLFYFTPHKKWYLVFQAQPPQYCTTEDISKPETWTKPQNFFEGRIAGMPRLPIDYHIIADDTHVYLFFTGDDGNFYRSRTKIEDFPKGMSDPQIAIRDNRNNLFEASITYKIKGTDTYLTLVEAMSPARYYRAWTADRLDGQWTPVPDASTWQKPFAGINNVTFEEGVAPWTRDISHGELIRDGYDERMILDPKNLQLLYQGRDPAIRAYPGVAFLPDMVVAADLVSDSNPTGRLMRIEVGPPLSRVKPGPAPRAAASPWKTRPAGIAPGHPGPRVRAGAGWRRPGRCPSRRARSRRRRSRGRCRAA